MNDQSSVVTDTPLTSRATPRQLQQHDPINRIPLTQEQQDINRHRRALPITAVSSKLLRHIQENSTLIIVGEPGCGLSTQVPQLVFDLEFSLHHGIAVTQPRRAAAISIATRVAKEFNCPLGERVGYAVRFKDMTSYETKLKFVTDGTLVREAMQDPLLKRYSIIILDEVHERSRHTDILFGIVKKAQQQRKQRKLFPLKILIMSAAMNVDNLKKYFGCQAVYIEGRSFDVNIKHVLHTEEDYPMACLRTLFMIHKEQPTSDGVLIVMADQEEVESMVHMIEKLGKDPRCEAANIRVLPLHAALPLHAQLHVFEQMPENVRKVVVNDGMLHTVSGIRYVIDSGMVKVRTYSSTTRLEVMKVERASKTQIFLRAGRAGLESDGHCYRVFSRRLFDSLPEIPVPEMLRSNLSSVVMQLAVMNEKADSFDFIDKPPPEAIAAAWWHLRSLRVVDNKNSLTDMGRQMARFPLEPRYSRILLVASEYGCLEEALTIVAMLSAESIFVTTPALQKEVASIKMMFASPLGDHLTLLNIFKAYQQAGGHPQWCLDHFIDAESMAYVTAVRKQLAEECTTQCLRVLSCGAKVDLLRCSLVFGLLANTAQLCGNEYVTLSTRQPVAIHPSSVLHGTKPSCVAFSEAVQTSQCFMKTLTVFELSWVGKVFSNI